MFGLYKGEAKQLLRHLGRIEISEELFDRVGLTDGDIGDIANASRHSPPEMVERGIELFVGRMYREGFEAHAFNLRNMLSDLVQNEHYFPSPLNRLAMELNQVGM